jgi:Leucine-rich repeat (LRR) protein
MCEGVTMSIKYAPLLGAKTLDRSLEEAESSGILNLNGRNLRNLSCCEDYDISDVTEADLSRNRFTEIPSELCACASLESLVCHHNAIKSIPDRIEQLKQLTHMDCSRNQLFSIPSSLCLLELETLILRNNRLSLLPPEVGSLKRLLELDVSNNELKLLPSSIGEMKRLRTLKLRRNQLTELPDSLCQLKLVHIDVTSNLLKSLPLSLTRLTSSLSTLEIDSNPLESPPSEVCARGLSHILRYLLRKADDQVRPQRSNSSRRARTLDRVSRRQLDTIPQASTLNSYVEIVFWKSC